MRDLLNELCALNGVSGDEGAVRDFIRAQAEPYADSIRTDALGNLIVQKKGSGPRVMLCAHMDSIGFIVTHIEKEGFLRLGRVGGIAASVALYTPVRFKNGVRGVFAKEEKAELKGLKLDSCYVDIGAADQEAAKKLVQVGDTAVYDTPAIRNGDKVISPYLDNRIACAVLLDVLARLEDCPNDLYLVFSVQEEVGLRGAKTAAWAIDPDYALAVDVTDVDDTPGSERCGTVQLGKGAAIKVMDSSVICHPAVISALEEAAKTANIPVQKDIMRAGGTDAGAIHTTRLGVLTGGVSIPCRYIHTPVEMADLNDAKHCADLLLAFVCRKLEPIK